MTNELWRNQIEQINVLQDKGIELVPRVGNHVVYLGNLPEANAVEKREKDIQDFVNRKMSRLENFYKYDYPKLVGTNTHISIWNLTTRLFAKSIIATASINS